MKIARASATDRVVEPASVSASADLTAARSSRRVGTGEGRQPNALLQRESSQKAATSAVYAWQDPRSLIIYTIALMLVFTHFTSPQEMSVSTTIWKYNTNHQNEGLPLKAKKTIKAVNLLEALLNHHCQSSTAAVVVVVRQLSFFNQVNWGRIEKALGMGRMQCTAYKGRRHGCVLC
jgi:hypothetical protein